MSTERIKQAVIGVVAVHSVLLGLLMLTFARWTLRTFGWDDQQPLFFPAQSGIFLLILGAAYWCAIWDVMMARLLIFSKAMAVVFLITAYVMKAAPSMILLAAANDAVMGSAVAYLVSRDRARKTRTNPAPNPELATVAARE